VSQQIFDSSTSALLERLYDQDTSQSAVLGQYFSKRVAEGSLDWNVLDEDAHRFLADKMVALERDKAEFCYRLCRALRARRVVEAGTSYGVSTLYLAAAVRANLTEDGGHGAVIGTEYEAAKANAAQRHFEASGFSDLIDLRVGDLRETLRSIEGRVDFMLIDIWTPMARPALELVAPHLRRGAIVIADNTMQFRAAYSDYFAFLSAPANRLSTMTLPFKGGLELSVRV
jgi:predicted O-methyltransferase YrrM